MFSGIKQGSSFIHLHVLSIFIVPFDESIIFYSMVFLAPLSHTSWLYLSGFISELLFLFHWSMCLFFILFYWLIVDSQYYVHFWIQQRDTYIYIYIRFFPLYYSLLQDTECSYQCYTVEPCCLSLLYTAILPSNSKLLIYSSPPFGNHKYFSIPVSLFLFLNKFTCVTF